MVRATVGIMAYNEAANLGRLLDCLLAQRLKKVEIERIVVIASGCTDGTEQIVRRQARKHPVIMLRRQKKRQGKASAINLFIQKVRSPVLVMISADTLPEKETLEKLVSPLADSRVGMTSARVVPTNSRETFMGFYVTTFWRLHHEVAKRTFKAGELVAWRNVIPGIDPQTSTDETNIAALILKKKLKTVYVPRAVVYNHGPDNFWDYLKVRRRHLAAYYHLREKVGLDYLPATMDNKLVLKLYLCLAKPKGIKECLWLMGVIGTEAVGRLAAWYDWRVKKEHYPIWPIANSTKKMPGLP